MWRRGAQPARLKHTGVLPLAKRRDSHYGTLDSHRAIPPQAQHHTRDAHRLLTRETPVDITIDLLYASDQSIPSRQTVSNAPLMSFRGRNVLNHPIHHPPHRPLRDPAHRNHPRLASHGADYSTGWNYGHFKLLQRNSPT